MTYGLKFGAGVYQRWRDGGPRSGSGWEHLWAGDAGLGASHGTELECQGAVLWGGGGRCAPWASGAGCKPPQSDPKDNPRIADCYALAVLQMGTLTPSAFPPACLQLRPPMAIAPAPAGRGMGAGVPDDSDQTDCERGPGHVFVPSDGVANCPPPMLLSVGSGSLVTRRGLCWG